MNKQKLQLGMYEGYLDTALNEIKMEGQGKVELSLGADLGSTSYRLQEYTVDEDIDFGAVMEVNSDIGICGDLSSVRSASTKLYDNLEFTIKDVTAPASKPHKVFSELHGVKYGLYHSVKNTPYSRPSGVSKVELEVTYINFIVSAGLKIISLMNESGQGFPSYTVIPAITLPPSDFVSIKTMNTFKERLAGHYQLEFNRLGLKFNIVIHQEDIYLEKEPDAVVYAVASDVEEITETVSVILDGGGKSTDQSLVVGGRLIEKGSGTQEYGGEELVTEVINIYRNDTGKSEPERGAVRAALANGILIRGLKEVNISKYIKKAKEDMATKMFSDVLTKLGAAGVQVADVGAIVYHGRLFEDTKTGNDTFSIYNSVNALFQQYGAEAETVRKSDIGTIVGGVITSRVVSELE